MKRFRSPRDQRFVEKIETRGHFTARQLPDSICFLKEEAEYIITPIFFKEQKKEECSEVRTREMLGGGVGVGGSLLALTSDKAGRKHANAACGSTLVHVWTVITRRRGPYMRISMN